MIPPVLFVAALLMGMLLAYPSGRYDASAATLSFLIQIASYASLLLVPVGLTWIVSQRRPQLWHRLTCVLAGFILLVTAIAAVAVNQLAIGVMLGIGAFILLRDLHRRTRADLEHVDSSRHPARCGIARLESVAGPQFA